MLVLGLNAYHGDSAACVFLNGQLIAAAEEERFRRIKHWAGLPTQAIDHCLKEAGTVPSRKSITLRSIGNPARTTGGGSGSSSRVGRTRA